MTAAAPAAGAGHVTAYVLAGLVAAVALLVAGLRHAGTVQGRRAIQRAHARRGADPPGSEQQIGAGGRPGLRQAIAALVLGLAIVMAAMGVIGIGWAALFLVAAIVLAAPRRALALARHGGRHARQAAAPAWGRLHDAAERRWNARQPAPLLLTRTKPPEEDGMKTDGYGGQNPLTSPASPASPGTRRWDGEPETAADKRFFDLRESGYSGPIDQDGNIPDPANPVTRRMLDTLHALHALRGSGDQADAPAATRTPTEGDQEMTTPEVPVPRPRASGDTRANVPGAWKQVVAATADFEPDDDGELLEWMAAEVAGMSAYAEALTEVYETCVHSLGVDPAAMNAVHDTADAAADAATAMAYARGKFASHYAEVREFAASGGLLPYDGRWITGDGDA